MVIVSASLSIPSLLRATPYSSFLERLIYFALGHMGDPPVFNSYRWCNHSFVDHTQTPEDFVVVQTKTSDLMDTAVYLYNQFLIIWLCGHKMMYL